MEGEEEAPDNSGNSEIRYITLELMKLAQKSGKSFGEVASEYLDNAEKLQKMIFGEQEGAIKAKGERTRER